MAASLNKVMLIGNLGDVVKVHYFEGGNAVGRFSLATDESYRRKDTGEKIKHTEWHSIVVKNKLAELCEKYLEKGDKVYCEGKLKHRQWEQDGVTKVVTEVHVTDMKFLSMRKSTTQTEQQNNTGEGVKETNFDLPF